MPNKVDVNIYGNVDYVSPQIGDMLRTRTPLIELLPRMNLEWVGYDKAVMTHFKEVSAHEKIIRIEEIGLTGV